MLFKLSSLTLSCYYFQKFLSKFSLVDVIVQQQQFFMTSQGAGIEQNLLDIHDRVKYSSMTWKQILLMLKQKECTKGLNWSRD